MPGSSNNSSFIPKRGTTKHTRKVRKGGVYVLSILSSVALFASLAASAAVYFYSNAIARELDSEISAMSDAVSNFKEADLRRVKDFDLRLDQARQRLDSTVSIGSIFEAIEAATVETVRFNSFLLQRNADDTFVVEAEIFTDSFDSTIFQRGIFNDNGVVEQIEIVDVALQQETLDQEDALNNTNLATASGISFTAFLSIPISSVPYVPNKEAIFVEEELINESEVAATEQPEIEENVSEEVAPEQDDNQPET